MNNLSRRISLCAGALAVSVLALTPAHADLDPELERERLDNKQAELADRLSRLDKVSAAHGAYVLLRDGSFLGDQGVVPSTRALYDDLRKWLQEWHTILALLERSDPSQPQARTELLDRVADQVERLGELGLRAYALEERTRKEQERLRAIAGLSPELSPTYGAQLQAFEQEKSRLNTAFSTAGALGTQQRRVRLSDLGEAVGSAVRNRIKAAMINPGPLRDALAQVDEMFRAQAVTTPVLAETKRTYEQLRTALIESRAFAAESLKADLARQVTAAKETIRSERLDPKFSARALQWLDSWREGADALYQDMIEPYPKAFVVKTLFIEQGALLAEKCRDASKRLEVNCELYRRVFAIPADRIDTMAPEELRYLEASIASVSTAAPISTVSP